MLRFSRRETAPDNPPIDLTPLIDTVFLLLIFFAVAGTLIKENYLNIELPKTSERESGVSGTEPIVIGIGPQSQLYWQRELLQDISALEQRLRGEVAAVEKDWVIQADTQTPHGTVVQVFDVLRRNKILRLSIATDLQPLPASPSVK
jgi:biopolymer transport protein ExbD